MSAVISPITGQPLTDKQSLTEAFPLADYVAKPDPNDPTRHISIWSDPFPVDPKADHVTLIAHRANFNRTPDNVVKARAELSLDAGKTWQMLVAFHTAGISAQKDGVDDPLSWCATFMPGAGNPNRMIRTELIPMDDISTKIDVLTDFMNISVQDPDVPHSVAFDVIGNSAGIVMNNASTSSWSSVAGSPSACAMLVGWFSGAAVSVTSSNYDTVALSANVTSASSASTEKVAIWGGFNPASGTKTVSVTMSGNIFGIANSFTVTGSDTTQAFLGAGVSATGVSSSPSAGALTSETGDLVISICIADPGSLSYTPGAGQTNRAAGTFGNERVAIDEEPGAASVTMSGTLGASSNWAMASTSFKVAGGGAAVTRPLLQSSMNGLGAGGEFFNNPLGRIITSFFKRMTYA